MSFILFCFQYAFAQPVEHIELLGAKKLKSFGKKYEKIDDYYSAIEFYSRYYDKKQKSDIALKLAEYYRKARDYEKAKNFYNIYYKEDSVNHIDALYYYAYMEKMTGNYESALNAFKLFRSSYIGIDLRKTLNADIEGCLISEMIIEDALDVKITHLDTAVNNAHIELAPFPYGNNQVVFSSIKEQEYKYYGKEESKPVSKLYISQRDEGLWKGAVPFSEEINNGLYHTANAAFSIDKKRMYFTYCEPAFEKILCNLYYSDKNERSWSKPKLINEITDSTGFTYTHPAVGKDFKTGADILYFVSDRPGGIGGKDIWYTIHNYKAHKYTAPVNVGPKINSEGDEVTPFYDNDNRKLYFSSNGFPGLGGYDIYYSSGEKSEWSKPLNVGYPINSETDDLYFSRFNSETEGYFTSNRKGGIALLNPTCCDDVYHVLFKDLVKIKIIGTVYEVVKDYPDSLKQYMVGDNLLNEAQVSLFITDQDEETEILVSTDTTNFKGEFDFTLDKNKDYLIRASKDGFFSNKQVYSTKNSDVIYERTKPIGLSRITDQPFVLQNIYYAYGKAELTNVAKNTIDTTLLVILNDSKDIIVEISSHTDSVSSDKFNLSLSQKRAESVVNYLVSKGIERKRMIAKGYGEQKPIAPNSRKDGSDNPEGRAVNRRTEFRVIGSVNMKSELNTDQLKILKKEEK